MEVHLSKWLNCSPLSKVKQMNRTEFIIALNQEPDMRFVEIDDGQIVVMNIRLDTETIFTSDAIERLDYSELKKATHHGKNVEHMTRVTGYFSKVEGWNKGKKGELDDRKRGTLEDFQ